MRGRLSTRALKSSGYALQIQGRGNAGGGVQGVDQRTSATSCLAERSSAGTFPILFIFFSLWIFHLFTSWTWFKKIYARNQLWPLTKGTLHCISIRAHRILRLCALACGQTNGSARSSDAGFPSRLPITWVVRFLASTTEVFQGFSSSIKIHIPHSTTGISPVRPSKKSGPWRTGPRTQRR